MAFQNPVMGRIEQEQREGRFATFRSGPAPTGSVPTPTSGDLEQMYGGPSATTADTGRLTYDDVIMKTAAQFVVLLAAAAVSWKYVAGLPEEHIGRVWRSGSCRCSRRSASPWRSASCGRSACR